MSTSLPKTLTLPTKAYYPVTDLQLFDRHNRATYTAAFGEQAPPWDPAKRIKRWFDTSPNAGSYTYFDSQARQVRTLITTPAEAAAINLPGVYAYLPYVVPPTPAVVIHNSVGDTSTTAFPVSLLCLQADAIDLAHAIGGGTPVEGQFIGQFVINWNGELRRNWLIPWQGDNQQASILLLQKNRSGLNSPGKWDLSDHLNGPKWIPAVQETGAQDPRPEIPIPVRALFPQEALAMEIFETIVYRTDMDSPFNKLNAPVGGSGGGLTDAQAQMLQRIDNNVAALTQRL
jgi:hypothetical protein